MIKVSFFGLSPRCINLMNLKSELVYLVLSIFIFDTLLDVSLHIYVLVMTMRFSIHAFLFIFIKTRVLVPARHLTFITPLIEEFLTPLDLHIQILELGTWSLKLVDSPSC